MLGEGVLGIVAGASNALTPPKTRSEDDSGGPRRLSSRRERRRGPRLTQRGRAETRKRSRQPATGGICARVSVSRGLSPVP